MLPLSPRSTFLQPSISEINPVSQATTKEEQLVPLIELASDGTFIWNLAQNPLLITEENYENDLQQSLKTAIEKRGSVHKHPLSDFRQKFLKACDSLVNNTSEQARWKSMRQLVIPTVIITFEELLCRDDISFHNESAYCEPDDFFNIGALNKVNFEIYDDLEAYAVFLLYVVCILTADSQHTKFLNCIKDYKRKASTNFDDNHFIKKMAFLGLSRTMDKMLLIKMLTREIEKMPSHRDSLGAIMQYVKHDCEIEDALKSATVKMGNACNQLNFTSIIKFYKEALDLKAGVSRYCLLLNTFALLFITYDKKSLALEMCEMTLAVYPENRKILQIRDSIKIRNPQTVLLTEMQTMGINPYGNGIETEISKFVSGRNGKLYDLTAQKTLRPIIGYDATQGYVWDFNQNDWLLDRDTWGLKLMEDFHATLERQYPDVKPAPAQPQKAGVQKVERVSIYPNGQVDVSATAFASSLPTKNGQIEVVELLNLLILKKMWSALVVSLNEIFKPQNKIHLTISQEYYISYFTLMLGLIQKDKTKIAGINTYFEIYTKRNGNSVCSPFFEKLKALTYASSFCGRGPEEFAEISTKVISYIDRCLTRINTGNISSMLLLKAEFLIEGKQFKQCRVLLENILPKDKEKPEYLKVLCHLEFHCGNWKAGIKLGEKYLTICHREDLHWEDLSVCYALSTMYRYNDTIGNGELVKRLIQSLKNPQSTIHVERFQRLFFSIIFNVYVNSHAVAFSTHEIPFIEGESSSMRSAKEVALLYLHTFYIPGPKTHSQLDERLALLKADPTISKREEVPYIAEICHRKGCAHFEEKNYARALELFETVEGMVRNHMEANEYRVRCLLVMEEYDKAYQLLKQCLEKSFVQTTWIEPHVVCLMMLTKFEEALAVTQKGFKENPTYTKLLLHEIRLLTELERHSEVFERTKIALKLDLERSDRLAIVRNIQPVLRKIDPELLETQLTCLLDNSGDLVETEALYVLTMLQIYNDKIQKAKELLASYQKEDYVKFFIQASIEQSEGKNEQALISLSKSLEIKPKIKDKVIFNALNFYIPEEDFKLTQYGALIHLGKFHEITLDNFNWVHPEVSIEKLQILLDFYILACARYQRLDLALKACDRLLKTHKRFKEITIARENVLAELEIVKAKALAAQSMAAEETLKQKQSPPVEVAESAQKSEKKEAPKEISFIFQKKPMLHLEKKKENQTSFKMPTHPALIKQRELDLKQAEIDVTEMFRLDPNQLEVHYPMSILLQKRFEPFAPYGVDEPLPEEIKPNPKQPKEPMPKTVHKDPVLLIPSKLPEAPKRLTKSLAVAAKELGIEIPTIPMTPSSYQERFEGAQIASQELSANLTLITKKDSNVHPLLKNPQFASRYLTIHLFRMVELLKPTQKGLTSEKAFKANVELVFTECRNVVLLRNLITLHGHRTTFEDLKNFCATLVSSGVPDNLSCIAFGKKVSHPPFRFNLKELFPIVFKEEWESLDAPAKMKALLAMIDLELEFLGMLKSNYDLPLYEEKGRDACEVIKISVLRIGKAFSYMSKKLNIKIADPEFEGIVKASYKIRHQITKPNAEGLPRELQPKWLSAFISKHDMLRERIKWKFASWL